MPTVYARTLKRASDIVGGETALARRLSVGPEAIAHWLQGNAIPPTSVFLQAVDIVTAHDALNIKPKDRQ
jgi:DNA-binding transcriptional regulator YdaS (Cro superfamily)